MKIEEKDSKIVDKVVDRKIVNKKSSNLIKILKKNTDALYIRLIIKRD